MNQNRAVQVCHLLNKIFIFVDNLSVNSKLNYAIETWGTAIVVHLTELVDFQRQTLKNLKNLFLRSIYKKNFKLI